MKDLLLFLLAAAQLLAALALARERRLRRALARLLQLLLSPGLPTTLVKDINNHDQIIGSSAGHRFIWTAATGMQKLDELIDDAYPGYHLIDVSSINDRGQIVGVAQVGGTFGRTTGVILTPIPEPGTLVLLATALAAVPVSKRWHAARR